MCGMFEVVAVNGDDLVTTSKLAAQIGRSTGQDERDENAFSILTAHNVETQSSSTFRQHHRARSPEQHKHS